MGTSDQLNMTWKMAASPQSAGGQLMVGFGSWLRTPALTKSFPSLAPVAPGLLFVEREQSECACGVVSLLARQRRALSRSSNRWSPTNRAKPKKESVMSKKAAEHHRKASEHSSHAARHHEEAAKQHEAGHHEKAAHHAHTAGGHERQSRAHSGEAAKAHADEYGKK